MHRHSHPASATVNFDASSSLLQGDGDSGIIPATLGEGSTFGQYDAVSDWWLYRSKSYRKISWHGTVIKGGLL